MNRINYSKLVSMFVILALFLAFSSYVSAAVTYNINVPYNSSYDIDVDSIPGIGNGNWVAVHNSESGPSHGDIDYKDRAGLVLPHYRTVEYTPDTNYCGSDSFTFTARNRSIFGWWEDQTVTINVTITGCPTPAALTSSIAATPATVTPGQTITVVMTVSNTGGTTANGVTPSALTLGGTSTATPVTSPSPANISAGGSATFTWTYTAGSAGTVNFTGNATGTGAISGATVSSTASTSNDVTILGNNPIPETILYPSVTLQRLIVPIGPIPIDGSIGAIIDTGTSIIIDGKEVPILELSEGTKIIIAQVENRGFLTQTDATIKFEKLPQGISIGIDPQSQKIKAHSTGSYILTINVLPEVPKGEYLITVIASTRRGVLDTETIKLIIS
ncbi:MAG: CARDB domain-containing protein [Methanofastidiosum sp.]